MNRSGQSVNIIIRRPNSLAYLHTKKTVYTIYDNFFIIPGGRSHEKGIVNNTIKFHDETLLFVVLERLSFVCYPFRF